MPIPLYPDGQDQIRAHAVGHGWARSTVGITDTFTRSGSVLTVRYKRAYPGYLCVWAANHDGEALPSVSTHLYVVARLEMEAANDGA